MSVSLRFCPECSFLLQPVGHKKDGKIVFKCERCSDDTVYSREDLDEDGDDEESNAAKGSNPNVVRRNDLVKTSKAQLNVFNENSITDPTMMRAQNTECPNDDCRHNEAIMFMASAGAKGADGMKLVFICTRCKKKWLG